MPNCSRPSKCVLFILHSTRVILKIHINAHAQVGMSVICIYLKNRENIQFQMYKKRHFKYLAGPSDHTISSVTNILMFDVI